MAKLACSIALRGSPECAVINNRQPKMDSSLQPEKCGISRQKIISSNRGASLTQEDCVGKPRFSQSCSKC